METILSTEKLMLPNFWLEAGPKALEATATHWCDNWCSAERRDLMAARCINAELSKSFVNRKKGKKEENKRLEYVACNCVK
jgi:hypothetical protein